jgi:FKBP12-rapamycin complex-associated protein
VIQLNNADYYSTVTIKTLLKILTDPSLHPQHDLAIDTIKFILHPLKTRTANFLHLIIPVFAKIIKVDDLRDKLLVLIERVIRQCTTYFDPQFIDPIIAIFLEYASYPKSTAICFDIMTTLIEYCKPHLKNKIEPLIYEINRLILVNEENKELMFKGLKIFRSLAELLDPYLYTIVPFLCELLLKECVV